MGEDPNNRFNCRGVLEYSHTIADVQRGSELAITVVDLAGNKVEKSFLIE